jgi:hypothetical protein
MLLIVTTLPVTGQIKEISTDENNDFNEKSSSFLESRWVKKFGTEAYDIGISVQQTSDNGYIILGATRSYGDIEQTTDGGYILVGRYEFAYYDRVGWLIKTDCDGNLKWEKEFQDYRLNRVHQTNDEGFIIAGVTNRYLLLLKVDKDGNEIWSKNFSYN